MTKEINIMYKNLREEINDRYGTEYPKQDDAHGWKLIGMLTAIAWVLDNE